MSASTMKTRYPYPTHLEGWISHVLQRRHPQSCLSDHATHMAKEMLLFFTDTKGVRDSVHDVIWLSEFERHLIQTDLFQRLRRLRQLDFSHLIYPAANHTRFSHSIGACHCAKMILDSAHNNAILPQRRASNAGERKDLYGDPTNSTSKLITTARPVYFYERVACGVAALLHDVSHAPLSHALEKSVPHIPKHDDYQNNPFMGWCLFGHKTAEPTPVSTVAKQLNKYQEAFATLYVAETMMSEFLREVDATIHAAPFQPRLLEPEQIQWIDNKIDTLLSEVPYLARLVFEILWFAEHGPTPDDASNLDWCEKYDTPLPRGFGFDQRRFGQPLAWNNLEKQCFTFYEAFEPFMSDAVSNTLCADLIDYTLRDIQATGLKRAIDLRSLSQFLVIRNAVQETKDPIPVHQKHRLVIRLEGRDGLIRRDALKEVLNLLDVRYILHERVVYHRTRLAAVAALCQYANEKVRNLAGNDDAWVPGGRLFNLIFVGSNPIEGQIRWLGDDDLLMDWAGHHSGNQAWNVPMMILNRNLWRPLLVIDESRLPEELRSRIPFIVRFFRPSTPADHNSRDTFLRTANSAAKKDRGAVLRSNGLASPKWWDVLAAIPYTLDEDVNYKEPLTLVEWPSSHDHLQVKSIRSVQREFIGIDRKSREAAYRSLWRLHIFVHPSIASLDYFGDVFRALQLEWVNVLADVDLFEQPLSPEHSQPRNEPYPGLSSNIDALILGKSPYPQGVQRGLYSLLVNVFKARIGWEDFRSAIDEQLQASNVSAEDLIRHIGTLRKVAADRQDLRRTFNRSVKVPSLEGIWGFIVKATTEYGG